MRKTTIPVLMAGACSAGLFGPFHLARADTNLVREIAKNRPKILIAAAGDSALENARALQNAIRAHPDWGRRNAADLTIVPVADAAAKLTEWGENRTTLILVLSGKATLIPENLKTRLPFDPKTLGTTTSVVAVKNDRDRPGEPIFRVGLYAPDPARLRRVLDEFVARRAENFRDLPFSRVHPSVRYALASHPRDQESLKNWGAPTDRDVWYEAQWHPLSALGSLGAEQLAERHLVLFTDRLTTPLSALPALLKSSLDTGKIGPTTLAIARAAAPNGEPLTLLSAPSPRALASRIARAKSPDDLSKETIYRNLPNLTRLGSTSLLIARGTRALDEDMALALHAYLSGEMRKSGLSIEPHGDDLARIESEIAAQMARGAQDTPGLLTRQKTSRYVWLFTVAELALSTDYTPSQKRLTREPAPFTDSEPDRPTQRRNESNLDYDRRLDDWRTNWNRWDRKRRDWDDTYRNTTVEWEQVVRADSRARTRGYLQLIDTKGTSGARVLWTAECAGDAGATKTHRQRRVRVAGFREQPDEIEAPANERRAAPELALESVQTALAVALADLRLNTLLPDDGLSVAESPDTGAPQKTPEITPEPPVDDPRPIEPRPGNPRPAQTIGALTLGKVADISGATVVLNVGARAGIKVGDRLELLLDYREIRDPDSGAPIRLRVTESVVVRVTHVDDTSCDAIVARPADAALLKKAKIGTPVRR